MSAGFPMGAVPGGVPGVPSAVPQAAVGFVLNIPADPNWEPMDLPDVLDKDGYYSARISHEKPRSGDEGKPGVFFTLELLDPDVVGKKVSKFMTDPNSTTKNTWFTWRMLIRSIAGNTQQAKAQFQYVPGCLTGQIVYFKTQAYLDDNNMRTGVDTFVTKPEWEDATKNGRHRWEAKVRGGGGGAAAMGALPQGISAGFPGVGGGGLPGSPSAGGAPRPSGMPPVQGFPSQAQAAAAPGFPAQAAPPAAAPQAQAPAFAPQAAPPAAAPPAPAFASAPAAAAPPAFAAPPAGAPAPGAPAFPGFPPSAPAAAPAGPAAAPAFPGFPPQQ